MYIYFLGSGDAGASAHRSMGNGRTGNGRMSPVSPLKRFGQAKKSINDLFKDIMDFMKAADAFFQGLNFHSVCFVCVCVIRFTLKCDTASHSFYSNVCPSQIPN